MTTYSFLRTSTFRSLTARYTSITATGSARAYNTTDIVSMAATPSNHAEKKFKPCLYLILKMLENIFHLLNENNIKRLFNRAISPSLYPDIVKCKFREMITFWILYKKTKKLYQTQKKYWNQCCTIQDIYAPSSPVRSREVEEQTSSIHVRVHQIPKDVDTTVPLANCSDRFHQSAVHIPVTWRPKQTNARNEKTASVGCNMVSTPWF